MTYLEILEVLESAARTVDPDATYFRGRLSDISLESVSALINEGKNKNLIYCEDVQSFTPQSDVNTTEAWTFRIGFFRQDSPSSESMEANQVQTNEESREIIFSETLILAREYLDALYNEDQFQINSVPRLTQVTRIFQGCLTGWGCDIVVQLGVGCDYQTEIQDAIYKNSDDTFEQSIKRGVIYAAPDIEVTDSDGSTYEHPANKAVVCTPSASPATVLLKDTGAVIISTTSVDPGTTETITAPDGIVNIKASDGDIISSVNVKSNEVKDSTIPDVDWTNSDGTAESTAYGDNITCTAQVKTLELYLGFESGHDTSMLVTNTGTTWTLTALAQDGSSGTITVSVNGAAYAAFVNPTAITNGQTVQVKRTSTGSAGSVTITGTYA